MTDRRRRWLWGIPLWILALAFLAPFAWMLSTSLKQSVDAYRIPMQWIPKPAEWKNYAEVLVGDRQVPDREPFDRGMVLQHGERVRPQHAVCEGARPASVDPLGNVHHDRAAKTKGDRFLPDGFLPDGRG